MNNKKVKEKTIRFKDYPEFRPNLTPRKIFLLGSFGGTYWRPITSKVTKKSYKNKHKEFPKSWWKGIPNKWLTSPVCNVSINNYGVKSGTSLRFWEKKGWMNKKDPYGWVQWYCRFYKGRRTPDDKRQIKRWLRFAGPKGRFKRRLVNMIKKKKTKYNDYKISPVIRQGLQHWAYRLVPSDVRKKPVRKKKVKRKRKKVKRRRKFGTQRALEFRKASYEDLKRLGLPDGLVRKILLMSHMNLSPQLGASIRQLPRLRTPQENAQIVREILENGQNVIAPFINLRGANLAQLVLGDAVLRGANLHNADLRGAHLYGVNLQGANLKGANLRRADLTDGNLQGANLKGANLVNAELGANLKGANFQGANLDYCWITGADLRETNLDNAFSLHMVRYNNQTRFPVGFDPTTRELPPDFGRIKQMINVDNFYHSSRLL